MPAWRRCNKQLMATIATLGLILGLVGSSHAAIVQLPAPSLVRPHPTPLAPHHDYTTNGMMMHHHHQQLSNQNPSHHPVHHPNQRDQNQHQHQHLNQPVEVDLKRLAIVRGRQSDWPPNHEAEHLDTDESVNIESTVGAPPPPPPPSPAASHATLQASLSAQVADIGQHKLWASGHEQESELAALLDHHQPMLESADNKVNAGPTLDPKHIILVAASGEGPDLSVAAGHYSPKKHHKHHHHHSSSSKYYMYAQSHHKGDFDSGYKMGGHKMTMSGHSSQHKGHASGHVKWKGKKGKGMHTWEYSHKDKKKHDHHYGHGHH